MIVKVWIVIKINVDNQLLKMQLRLEMVLNAHPIMIVNQVIV